MLVKKTKKETVENSEAGKHLSSLGASKGGRARASVLSAEERTKIARNAVKTRWAKQKGLSIVENEFEERTDLASELTSIERQPIAKSALPKALFQGTLSIGDSDYICYVLDNGKRVLTQREVVRLFTGHAKGNLDRYLNAGNLQPYFNTSLIDKSERFVLQGSQALANGYEATLILDIADAYLRARIDGVLDNHQTQLARQAEIFTRACAKVGIIALIDEATGYQKFRKEKDLQIKLQAFIAEELQEWARMFPQEFWLELARIEGVHYSPRSRPLRWGKYIMMFVYDAIDGDIGQELRRKNPSPHFLKNHHQWLKKFGRDKVHDQIERVITIMKLCENMNEFRQKFDRVFKKSPIQISFDDIGWGEGI
jgi:P63C domain